MSERLSALADRASVATSSRMIKSLMKFIQGEEQVDGAAIVAAEEARVAVAAVMVEAAKRDDHYDPRERDAIDRSLAEAYDLAPAPAAALRQKGEKAQAAALDVFQFTRVIKDTIAHEDRGVLLERIWRVVLADDQRDPDENAFMRKLGGLLYVEDRDNGLARRRAEASRG